VQITVKIVVRCETAEELSIREALAAHNAIRDPARMLNTKIGLLFRGHTEAIATIAVDDGAETFVNLGDIPNEFTPEQPKPR